MQDNALIYAEIKNNINSENYPAYDYFLSAINSNGSNLNDILSKTVIKKACCAEKQNATNSNYYETDVLIPATTSTQNKTQPITINVKKSYCDPLYVKNTFSCNSFSKVYCENSKFLYDSSTEKNNKFNIRDNSWETQVPWCKNHKLMIDLKSNAAAELVRQEESAQARRATDELIERALNPVNTNGLDLANLINNSFDSNSGSNSGKPSGKPSGKSTDESSNNIYYIVGSVLLLLCIISIIVIIVIIKKKKDSE
jgi:hypothetical protein